MKNPIADYSLLSLWEWLWLQGDPAPDTDGEVPEPVAGPRP